METAKIDPWLWHYDRVISSDPEAAREVLDEMLANSRPSTGGSATSLRSTWQRKKP